MKLVLTNNILYEEDSKGQLTPIKPIDKSTNLIINLRDTLEIYKDRIKKEKNQSQDKPIHPEKPTTPEKPNKARVRTKKPI